MPEPIRQITTTAKAPSSSGITPYDLLFTGTDSSDIFSELTFGEGSAAPTEGMQAEILLDAITSGDVDPKTLSPELKALVKDRLIAQGVSEADANKVVGDDTTTFYDMENALALGAAKEAGLDFGGPFGASLAASGAPSGTPLGRLSDEDLLERYKSAVASLEYVQQQPRTLPGTGTYTEEGQEYLDEVFGDISDAKKEVAKYVDEINARGLDFPKEATPYGGKVGTVIGPQGATTTVVLGDEAPNIPGTDTGIYAGSYRIPGGTIVDTGVTTGSPVIDDIIKVITGQEVGGEVTATDVMIEEASRRTGIPIDDILDALEDSGIFGPSAPSGAQSQTQTQTQTGGATTQTRSQTEEDTEEGGPFSAPVTATAGGLGGLADIFGKIKDLFDGDTDEGDATTDTGATTRTTTTTDATPTSDTAADIISDSTPTSDTPADIIAGGGPSDIVAGGGPSDIVAGGGPSDIVAGGGDGSTIEAGSTIQTGGGGGFGVPTETPSATGQGLTGVSTEKAGVADIGDPYQLSASLYENIMRILQQDRENRRDDRNRTRPYYGGGQVRNADIDELIRLIRG